MTNPIRPILCVAPTIERSEITKIRQALDGMGWNLSTRPCVQIDMGRNREPSERRIERSFNDAQAHYVSGALAYIDWEYDGYVAIDELRPTNDAIQTAAYCRRAREIGYDVGVWNQVYMTERRPYFNRYQYAALKVDTSAYAPQACFPNTYARFAYSDDPQRFTERIVYGVTIGRATMTHHGDHGHRNERTTHPSFQLRIRGRGGAIARMDERTAMEQARAFASVGAFEPLWWFEAGTDGTQIDDRLAEAERLIEPWLDGATWFQPEAV